MAGWASLLTCSAEGITQTEAAIRFGVTQPRVSDLVRGKIELFSVDALINMLAAAGHHVEISVMSSQASARAGVEARASRGGT